MHTSEYDYLFKLLLIGDSGVGKVLRSNSFSLSQLTDSPF
jgi:GTPase SAR1 family protein